MILPDEALNLKIIVLDPRGHKKKLPYPSALYSHVGTLSQELNPAKDDDIGSRRIYASSRFDSLPGVIRILRAPSTNINGTVPKAFTDDKLAKELKEGNYLVVGRFHLDHNDIDGDDTGFDSSNELNNFGKKIRSIQKKNLEVVLVHSSNMDPKGDNKYLSPVSSIGDDETMGITIQSAIGIKTFFMKFSRSFRRALKSQLIKAIKKGIPDSTFAA